MRKEDKATVINQLKTTIGEYSHFYLADIAGLNSEQTSSLRRQCFENDIKLLVVKNTLLKRLLNSLILIILNCMIPFLVRRV